MFQGVIFLDVDGVLTMSRCLCEYYDEESSGSNSEGLIFARDVYPSHHGYIVPLERDRLMNLKWILDQLPQIAVVLSTTWRQETHMTRFLMRAMEVSGIDVAHRVVGSTPILSCLDGRGAEIRTWLGNHPHYCHAICIIDDDHEHSFQMHDLSAFFVKTIMRDPNQNYEREGLTAERAEYAVKLLKEQLQVCQKCATS